MDETFLEAASAAKMDILSERRQEALPYLGALVLLFLVLALLIRRRDRT